MHSRGMFPQVFFTLSRAFPHKPRGREASAGREMRIARTVAGYAAAWNDSRYELGIRILRVVSCLSRGLLAQETVRSCKQDSRRRRRAATRECFVSRTPVGYMNERPLLLDRAMRNKPGGLQAKSPRPRDLEVTLLERSGGAYYRTQTDALSVQQRAMRSSASHCRLPVGLRRHPRSLKDRHLQARFDACTETAACERGRRESRKAVDALCLAHTIAAS